MSWLANNIDTIFAIIGFSVTVCSSFVEFFSKSSNKWVKIIVKICDWLSIVNTEENKQKIINSVKKGKK